MKSLNNHLTMELLMHMVQCLLPPHVNCSKKTLGKHKDEHGTIIE